MITIFVTLHRNIPLPYFTFGYQITFESMTSLLKILKEFSLLKIDKSYLNVSLVKKQLDKILFQTLFNFPLRTQLFQLTTLQFFFLFSKNKMALIGNVFWKCINSLVNDLT